MADPSKLGKYEIRSELGRGAMGVVYEAFDPLIERRVAIKTIRTDIYDGTNLEAVLQRFEREAKAAGRLNHPRIVTIYDYGRDGETAYIVMEFVDGKPLSALFEHHTQFMLADTVRIISQILDALGHAHSNGVIHRDIKPANILVLPSGDIKVTDFGIARLESSTLTQTGSRLGTPLCMSPEQFLGQEVDRRTDIFSVGVILYELLTGERPFPGSSLTTIMHQVLKVEPPLPTELNLTLPPALDAVVRKAIAKRPDERYPSAEQFSRALQLAAREQPPLSIAEPPAAATPTQESSLGFQHILTDTQSTVAGNDTIAATEVLEQTVCACTAPALTTPNPPPPTQDAPAKGKRWPWAALALLAVIPAAIWLNKPAPAPLAAIQPPPIKTLRPAEAPPAVSASALELEFWNSIRSSRDDLDFKEYLRKYPSGEFSGLALNRLAQLKPAVEKRQAPKPFEERPPAPVNEPQAHVAETPKNAGDFQRVPVEAVMQRARDGHDMAMNNLGMLYRDGRGVPQSDSEAVAWFRKAVEKGNAKAMTNLAIMYFKGRGVPRNEDEARRLMQRAAELGDDRARDMLTREGGMPDRQGGLPERRRPRPALP